MLSTNGENWLIAIVVLLGVVFMIRGVCYGGDEDDDLE